MTQRERIQDDDTVHNRTAVYDNKAAAPSRTVSTPTYSSDAVSTARPVDLVRWGSVIAGLFGALSTLAGLTVLGTAIGLGAYDGASTAGEAVRNLGLGAGIWGAISTLLAFLVGGWLAGRTAGVRNRNSGILNGSMVWFVAIPLLLFALGSGISALASTAGSVAGTAITAAGNAAGAAADQAATNPGAAATAQAGAASAIDNLQATAQVAAGQIDEQDRENAANNAGNVAWGTLLSLGLAAAASIFGGVLGSRTPLRADTLRA